MKAKHNELQIETNNPFLNCKLDREKYADFLTSTLQLYSDGFVLAINNKWGTGKTTFVRMWEEKLKKDFDTIFFNAWENDFEKDSLVALISEFGEYKDQYGKKLYKGILDKGATFSKRLLPGLLKGLLKKHVDDDVLLDAFEITTEIATESFEKEIQSYVQKRETIEDMRKDIESYVSHAKNNNPLVIFIDELDRCRPNYAVELLEKVKHLFNVKGVVFVLSIDKDQLEHAVKGVYGSEGIDACEYLRRFIDVEYSLPEPDIDNYCDYLYNYFKFDKFFMSRARETSQTFKEDSKKFKDYSKLLFQNANLSLRQIEKIFVHASIALNSFHTDRHIYPGLFIYLTYLKMFKKELYLRIKNRVLNIEELIVEFEKMAPKFIDRSELLPYIYVKMELLVFYRRFYNSHIENYDSHLPDLLRENEENQKCLAFQSIYKDKYERNMINMIRHVRNQSNETGLAYLLDKIEMLEKFSIEV